MTSTPSPDEVRAVAEGLTVLQRRIVLAARAECETDCPFQSFRHIAAEVGEDRYAVVQPVRDLRAIGVMEFRSGLWTDDGEPYGSGHALTDVLGLAVRAHLQQEQR